MVDEGLRGQIDGDFVEDGTGRIKLFALFSTILGAFAVFYQHAVVAIVGGLVDLQVWIILSLGSGLEQITRETLGVGAAVQVAAWRAAFVQAVRFGPLAPWLLVAEALLVISIAWGVWDRRPFA